MSGTGVVMASLRYEVRIAAPASVVWKIIEVPASIPKWFPGIIAADVEGSIRTITLATGLVIPEEILAVDALQRRFAYRILAPQYRSHLGTIDVIELDERDTLCVYATTAEPDALALIIGGASLGALDSIKRIAEGG